MQKAGSMKNKPVKLSRRRLDVHSRLSNWFAYLRIERTLLPIGELNTQKEEDEAEEDLCSARSSSMDVTTSL